MILTDPVNENRSLGNVVGRAINGKASFPRNDIADFMNELEMAVNVEARLTADIPYLIDTVRTEHPVRAGINMIKMESGAIR